MSDTLLPRGHDRQERVRYNREKAALRNRLEADLVRDFQLQTSVSEATERCEAWVAIKERLCAYTMRTFPPMICDGRVWDVYRQLGRPWARDLSMSTRGVDMDDARDLTASVIVSALPSLRRQLLEGRWDPAGGASLTTWFNNLCVMRLPGPWRAWRREQSAQPVPAEIALGTVVDPDDRPEAVIYDIEFERYVEALDDELGQMVRLDADGFTDAEIAQAVGRTAKSVEYQLTKAHDLARRRRRREEMRDQLRDLTAQTA